MNLKTIQLYPPRILKVMAALEAVEKKDPSKGRGAISYVGLAEMIKGTNRDALRLAVLEAKKRGVVECVRPGNGKGKRALFALTAEGRVAVDLPPLSR